MYRTKVIPLAIIAILLSFITHAEEYEGLHTSTNRETTEKDAKSTVHDGAYKSMSKTEMIQEIKDEVDSEEEILEQIPQLKRQKDKDGKDVYSYLVKGKQVNLEDVDEKILRTLITQVDEKAGQIRTNAIQEQLEQLRTIRSARPPQSPSQPPRASERPPALPRR